MSFQCSRCNRKVPGVKHKNKRKNGNRKNLCGECSDLYRQFMEAFYNGKPSAKTEDMLFLEKDAVVDYFEEKFHPGQDPYAVKYMLNYVLGSGPHIEDSDVLDIGKEVENGNL